MRRLFVCAVALLLAGCNAPPETNSTPRTSEPVAPLTTPSTVPLAGDRLPTRLAFEDGTVLRVLDGDGLSIDVGPSGTPVWSSDGRYLAWSTLERDETTGPLTMNAPESWTVYLLDTVTGRRIRYADRQHPLTGVLLAAGSGFVAPLSGRNNLGRDATDFVMLRYADIDLGNAPTAIHADFRLERPTSEYDFDWAAIQGDSLYVVVTDTSTLVYRYNPQLWRVSLGGRTERLFFDAVVGLSNLGMSPLAVSPDAAHVISQTGARSGVCYYAVEPVLRTIDGSFERIDGLPSRLSDGISLFIDSIEWIGRDAYLLSGRERPIDCNDHTQSTSPRLYRCTIEGGCRDTGIAARGATQSGGGDLAYLEPFPDNGRQLTGLVIQWKDGRVQRLDVDAYARMAWSS